MASPSNAGAATAPGNADLAEPARVADAPGDRLALRIDSNDADELAGKIPGWDVELTQLYPGSFSGHLVIISLGSVLLGCGKFNRPLLQRVAGPPGYLIVNRPGRGSAPLTYRGHEVQDDECFVGASAWEREARNGIVHFPTTLSVRLDAWAEAAWPRESPFLSMRGARLLKTGLPWATAFLDGMEWIVDAVARYPESAARTEVRASLADLLLSKIDALGTAAFPVSCDRATSIHRRAAVERARDYIRRNLTEPIRLSHLCRCARMESRALEYGFKEILGLTPMAYVRISRLHHARRMLRSANVLHSSVSQIALDSGFWHLSQFGADYKQFFGEGPSTTFRRTLAELPAAERRIRVLAVTRSERQRATT